MDIHKGVLSLLQKISCSSFPKDMSMISEKHAHDFLKSRTCFSNFLRLRFCGMFFLLHLVLGGAELRFSKENILSHYIINLFYNVGYLINLDHLTFKNQFQYSLSKSNRLFRYWFKFC